MRWLAVAVFVLSSTLNFLDRNLLGAVAPLIQKEFSMDDEAYGVLVGAFSLSYALASPAAGYLLDRLGLNRVMGWLVAWWSVVSIGTGFTRNFAELILCRVGLGAGESGGIPAVAKMGGMYLPPSERALGSALGQIGITLAGVSAPLLAGWWTLTHGWRTLFLITGAGGLLWIPLWLLVSRKVPPQQPVGPATGHVPLDLRLLGLIVANVLWMGIYSLWGAWTTKYFVSVHRLTLQQVAPFAAIPPVASVLGGLFGGWLAMRWNRLNIIFLAAVGCLTTLAVPYAPTPAWASVAISLSFFFCLAGSVNIYTLPVDLYGPARAGFAVSSLVMAYGLMQAWLSPVIGRTVMTRGYGPVCWMVALPPLAAWAVLRFTGWSSKSHAA